MSLFTFLLLEKEYFKMENEAWNVKCHFGQICEAPQATKSSHNATSLLTV